ncbi:pirin family protein [Microcoleus sp. FACHB-SPT15]|uniref:pirin family protein n=1 Tax=Microcoleus sp. FACHB-SPT15 TaxID=2692830 RepID=UPI00177A78A2|nr:pirin family protein [Microcoleus sp. FACHB-SPT15]MBD1804944.1 pirin family protein [Microcoleus sp. FACHB-SPT15]
MLTIRKAEDRGHANHGWLDSYHTFSFANYYDPKHMEFRALRVINEDRVIGGAGFGTHGHRDMEIITYVLEGSLEHKDSLGTGSVIQPGDVQRMSAGTGIRHSEFNHSETESVHFLQIWLLPKTEGIRPSYEQRNFELANSPGKLRLVAAPDAREGALTVHQDVDLYAAVLEPGDRISHTLQPQRHAWIQVARGAVTLNGLPLDKGDGVAISDETNLVIEATTDAEILLFDMA